MRDDAPATWGGTPPTTRLAWLRAFRRSVASRADELAALAEAEIGKPRQEALAADVMTLLASCVWLERHAPSALRERRLRGRPSWLLGQRHAVRREPLGLVGIIATWNYPIQLLGIQLAQALVAGNRVIVKPSELSPRTQARLLETAVEAGLPEGTLRWTEATREAGPRLLAEEPLDHVVFTGSTRIGRAIAASLAERLIPSTLELSGRDSAIVLDDADAALAARSIWQGVVMNAGQTCMAPRRALVLPGAYAPFVRALAPLAAGARPLRLVSADEARRAFGLATGAVDAGGRSLTGLLEPPDGPSLRPIAVADCPADADLVRGDHFAPAIAVVPVADEADALRVHAGAGQALATSVYSRSTRSARALASRLGSSHVTVNDTITPTAHPGAALGGVGDSGWGVTRGREGLLAMTRAVTVSTTSPRLRLPTGDPAPGAERGLLSAIRWLYNAGRPVPEADRSDAGTSGGADPTNTTPPDARSTRAPAEEGVPGAP